MKIAFATLLVFAIGCANSSNGPETHQVEGQVTLDGKPIDDGEIVFRPLDSPDRSYGGRITKGSYSFESTPGRKQVEISAMGIVEGRQAKVGGTPGEPISEENPAHVYEEIVPAHYNANSELTAEVTGDGVNKFDFELKSN